MRLKLAVKRVAAMLSAEERAAANEKELPKIVRNLIWLESTREYLDMSKPVVDEDDEDAEFVDSYDQLLDRFTKVVCDAEKQQVMSNAVTVGKKRRRSGNTEEKEKPTADEEKEEKPKTDVEDSESGRHRRRCRPPAQTIGEEAEGGEAFVARECEACVAE